MIRSLIFSVVAIAGMSAAQAQNVNLVDELVENAYPSAQSSGVAVVGAQVLPMPPASGSDMSANLAFSMYLPDAWSGEEICVSTESANGLYDGRATYKLEHAENQIEMVGYPTEFGALLKTYGSRELAIAVRRNSCGRAGLEEGMTEDEAIELTLAVWRPGTETLSSFDQITLLVNPFDAQKVRVKPEGAPIPCERLEVPVAASYAMGCPIELSTLGTSPATLKLDTLVPGRPPESTFIKLYFPTP
jgi:hypothetical protein